MKTKDEIKLLEKAICGYLPYKVKAVKNNVIHTITAVNTRYDFCELDEEINEQVEDIKMFLRPMSSMTDEEAIEFVSLYGVEDFLKVNVTQEYLEIIIDDGLSSTTVMKLWYEDIHLSVECFDFLLRNHFDFRNLIPIGLALPAIEGMYNDYKL